MRMRTIAAAGVLLGLAAAFRFAGPSASAASAGDIAYVSGQRILAESNEAKAANARLDQMRRTRSADLLAKQKALEATHQQLVQLGGVFNSSKRTAVAADEERQRAELKKATDDAQQEYQVAQRTAQVELTKHLGEVVAAFARDRKLRFVLNSDAAIMWAAPGTDLTAEVLAKLNAAPADKH